MAKLLVVGLALCAAMLVTAIVLAQEDWSRDESPLSYPQQESELMGQGPADVPAGGLEFNWTAPDNATGAHFVVNVTSTGQAVRGGAAVVTLEAYAPDGQLAGRATEALVVDPGSGSASGSFRFNVTWAATPVNQTADPDDRDETLRWEAPLVLVVRVEAPGDLPAATFAAQAEAGGKVLWFTEVVAA